MSERFSREIFRKWVKSAVKHKGKLYLRKVTDFDRLLESVVYDFYNFSGDPIGCIFKNLETADFLSKQILVEEQSSVNQVHPSLSPQAFFEKNFKIRNKNQKISIFYYLKRWVLKRAFSTKTTYNSDSIRTGLHAGQVGHFFSELILYHNGILEKNGEFRGWNLVRRSRAQILIFIWDF